MRAFVGPDDIVHAMAQVIAILETPTPSPDFSKAQAVRWLVHLVGDLSTARSPPPEPLRQLRILAIVDEDRPRPRVPSVRRVSLLDEGGEATLIMWFARSSSGRSKALGPGLPWEGWMRGDYLPGV